MRIAAVGFDRRTIRKLRHQANRIGASASSFSEKTIRRFRDEHCRMPDREINQVDMVMLLSRSIPELRVRSYHEYINLHRLNLQRLTGWLNEMQPSHFFFRSLPNEYWKCLIHRFSEAFNFQCHFVCDGIVDNAWVVYSQRELLSAGKFDLENYTIDSSWSETTRDSYQAVQPNSCPVVLLEVDDPVKSRRMIQAPFDVDRLSALSALNSRIGNNQQIMYATNCENLDTDDPWFLRRLESSRATLVDYRKAESLIPQCETVFTLGGKLGLIAAKSGKPVTCLADPWYAGFANVKKFSTANYQGDMSIQPVCVVKNIEDSLQTLLCLDRATTAA